MWGSAHNALHGSIYGGEECRFDIKLLLPLTSIRRANHLFGTLHQRPKMRGYRLFLLVCPTVIESESQDDELDNLKGYKSFDGIIDHCQIW